MSARAKNPNAKWLDLLSDEQMRNFVFGGEPCSHHKRIICDRELERRRTATTTTPRPSGGN